MVIDNLKLPNDVSITAEKINFDTSRRAVSGRLITKLAPCEKWKVTVKFDNLTLNNQLKADFYTKCLEMRNIAATVEFTDPYTGEPVTAVMRCMEKAAPVGTDIVGRRTRLFRGIGATFEEV